MNNTRKRYLPSTASSSCALLGRSFPGFCRFCLCIGVALINGKYRINNMLNTFDMMDMKCSSGHWYGSVGSVTGYCLLGDGCWNVVSSSQTKSSETEIVHFPCVLLYVGLLNNVQLAILFLLLLFCTNIILVVFRPSFTKML